jgi:GH18 family chitinase
MNTRATLFIALLAGMMIPALSSAQEAPRSIMRIEQERHARYGFEREEQWDSLNGYKGGRGFLAKQAACTLQKRVFGWNPYWEGTAYNDFDFSLLSDVCYFSYEVDPNSGSYTNIRSWKTTGLVDRAKEAGVRVHLCVTLFSGIATFLANPTSRTTLIDSLIALVKLRDADGVNIDFEGVPGESRNRFTDFMADLANRFHAEIPGSQVSIALPAVDWSNAFDVAAMVPYVDLFLVMGYDYHWRSAPNAGPVAPKNSGTLWGTIDVTRSVNNYLSKGIPPSKLALGVPYYGYDWPTVDSTIGAATTGAGTAVLYPTARDGALAHGRQWEPQSSTPYYTFRLNNVWHQVWYDDEESLRLKYDLVNMKGLAGIGIWALGYDDTRRELWSAIEAAFTNCYRTPCGGTFTDMGGPAGNYYDNDDYVYTIAPIGSTSVTISFYSFSIANDRLAIYDGRDTTAPLLGVFTGTDSPGTITGQSGSLTLRFTSGGSENSWGWIANWLCNDPQQDVPPAATDARHELRVLPNPSAGPLAVEYSIGNAARVRLSIVDMLGAERAVLFDDARDAGRHRYHIDHHALALPEGLYILRMRVGDNDVRDERLMIYR